MPQNFRQPRDTIQPQTHGKAFVTRDIKLLKTFEPFYFKLMKALDPRSYKIN